MNLNCSKPTVLPIKIRFSGDDAFEYDGKKQTVLIKRAPKKQTHSVFKRPIPQIDCEQYHGGLVTLDLANTYPDGTQLREVFTQQNVVVNNRVVTPIDLLMVKFTFYKRSNNLIVHLFAFR
ncbi:hypothetical protein ACUHZR_20265, partial [Photobacterium damselae subsp. piscicida]